MWNFVVPAPLGRWNLVVPAPLGRWSFYVPATLGRWNFYIPAPLGIGKRRSGFGTRESGIGNRKPFGKYQKQILIKISASFKFNLKLPLGKKGAAENVRFFLEKKIAQNKKKTKTLEKIAAEMKPPLKINSPKPFSKTLGQILSLVNVCPSA